MALRLLDTFEKQADHRMALEKHVIKWDVWRANAGLAAGFLFSVMLLAVSVWMIVNGQEIIGVTMFVAEFVALGLALFYSVETRRRERNRKAGR